MNELEKNANIDVTSMLQVATDLKNFAENVKTNVEKLVSKLPNDLTTLDVVDGDKMEAVVTGVVTKIEPKSKELYDSRMTFTRQLDCIKKGFTTLENDVKDEVVKLKSFPNSWNAEKLRRKRLEEDELLKVQQEKNRLIEVENEIKIHYSNLLNGYFATIKNTSQTKYYAMNSTDLTAWMENIKAWNANSTRLGIEKFKNENLYKISDTDFEVSKIHNNLMASFIQPLVEEIVTTYSQIINDLITFAPTRLEQLKEMDASALALEAEKLAKQQKEDDEAKRLLQDAEIKAHNQSNKIDLIIENSDVKPATELSKGVSVKLKYYPQNHAELLKMIQFYIHNEYNDADFETLNTRLSFVRTSCDSKLNKGTTIEGVTVKEEVSKRKTK